MNETATATAPHEFDASLLREYDIRGVVGDTLHEADANAVGRAFGTMVRRAGGTRVITGYDGRHSSPALEQALVDGLKSVGLHVERIGLGPTPMMYHTAYDRRADAGIQITGSHNPPDYNGIKMVLNNAPVYGDMIQEIGRVAAAGDFDRGEGSDEQIDVHDAYIERLKRDYHGSRELKVAWDAGNGAAGDMLRRLVAELPGEHVLLFDDIDGDFPNHHPDPTVAKNLVDLQKAVAEHGCDLGVAFDGDGDRIGAIDATGEIVWGDQMLAIYANEVLADHPGATVLADVKTSQMLFDHVRALGGEPMMWKTGHSLLKAKMKEVGSPLAGEMSGHIFFADKFPGYDDALYCAIRLISIVADSDQSLEEMREALPKLLNTPEVRFEVDDARKFAIVDEVSARVKADDSLDIVDIDGVRVNTDDGWWLLRASNTQNVLVVRAESHSEAGLDRLRDAARDQLGQSGVTIPDDF
ncbi:MAG: phosphomannomutase/phosphoglucomutase [Alphaproteobacteria bacterium]